MGMRKGMDFMCKRLELQKPDAGHRIYVVYTGDKSIGVTLAQKLTAAGYDIPDEQIVPAGAVIGSHTGPNACGLIYVAE
jgi:fatty acid-binding protein DegV